MKKFTAGDINRAEQEMIYPGGKGINVSLVLGNLHIPSKMLGFVAGFTGKEIERLAKANGGDTDFILLDEGCSRINLKVSADDETAVNGMGPNIPEDKLNALLANGDADVAFSSTGAYAAYQGQVPIELLAMAETNGTSHYQTYIITAADSDIHDFQPTPGEGLCLYGPFELFWLSGH